VNIDEGPNRKEIEVPGKKFFPPGGTVSCWEPDGQWRNAPGDSSIFWGCLKKDKSSTGQMSARQQMY